MGLVRVQAETFDAAEEARDLVAGRTDLGAVVSFVGLCRDEGARLVALEIEHYPGMAEAEIARVITEAEAQWPGLRAAAIHRYGSFAPGDPIVLVVTAAAHRGEAFAAAEMLMDYLKTRAPFWKRVRYADGSHGDWIEAKAHDGQSAARWGAGSRTGTRQAAQGRD